MSPLRIDQDYHVHLPNGVDVTGTTEESLREAEWAGLRSICFVERLTSSSRVTDAFAEVQSLRPMTDIEILTGIEVDFHDLRGHLEGPSWPDVDHVLISDQFLPSTDGPLSPHRVRSLLAHGAMTPHEVISRLVEATVAAMGLIEQSIIAHPFSFLKRIGIDELLMTSAQLRQFADHARSTKTWVEVNEKWACPGDRVIHELVRRGVRIVAGSDSRVSESVGVYQHVRRVHDSLKAYSSPIAFDGN